MGQGGPCSLEELHTVCNMDGLAYRFGSPSPFLPVPWWCVEGGGGLLDTEVLLCPSVSPSAATAGCGWEGEGVRTPLVGLRTICAWDWGSYLLGACTSGPECVTC